jgi:hypothetical protein
LDIWGFYDFGHLVMDGRADEAIVAGGEDEDEDVIGSNSATTIRRTTSLPLSKKHYKKLGIPLLQGNTLILVVQNMHVIVGSQNFIPQVRPRSFLGLDSPLRAKLPKANLNILATIANANNPFC